MANGPATDTGTSGDLMHMAVEASPTGMVMVDEVGDIILVNSSLEAMFGYHREELLGKPIDQLVPARFRAEHPVLRASYFQNPQTRAMGHGRDLFGLHRDGSEVPVEIGLNPVTIEDRTYVFAAIVDITERKQQEETLRQTMHTQEILLSEIHHRVKNNLQIIDSLIGMQMDQVQGEQARAALIDSQNRVKTIAIIHQILYQSQDYASVNIADVLSSLVDNLAQSYGLDRSRVQTEIDVDAVYLSIENSLPMGLIVNELVSNAMKHAFPGKREGCITVSLKRQEDGQVCLVIADTGIGIDENIDPEKSGSLGLRVVAALSDQLGGELKVQHRDPTRFELGLKLSDQENQNYSTSTVDRL